MTDTVTSQHIELISWITLYNDMITVVAVRIYVSYFPLQYNADEQNPFRKLGSVCIYTKF